MAGDGKRFKDAGYSTPKPLIKVDGKPMVIKALESLPKASKNILIVRKDQLNIVEFKSLLNNYFENVIIIEIDYLTGGQASTCLLSEKQIPKNSILNIHYCENKWCKVESKKDKIKGYVKIDNIWGFYSSSVK